MKNKITAGLVALGMALSLGVPMAAAYTAYGVTASPVAPIIWGSNALCAAHVSGTPTATISMTVRCLKNGVQQGTAVGYTLVNGTYYNNTVNVYRACSPGTWVTQVKLAGGSYQSSAGKYLPCL